MRKNSASQSGIFTPRVLVAFTLCSAGILLGMFSFGATPPVERTRTNTSLAPAPPSSLSTSTFGSRVNRLPGLPFPPGAGFSANEQDNLSSSPSAGVSGAGMPLRPEPVNGATSLGNPTLANQQPAPLSVPQSASSGSMPLAPATAGSWSIVASPNSAAAQGNYLVAVACVSASECWAVGEHATGGPYQTLIERWDGTSWTLVVSPNASATQTNILSGVTCVSASECWAVGYYYASTAIQTLIERWDGTAWTIVPSANTLPTQTNALNAVTCVSASDCWAVGNFYAGIADQTLIQRWNGTSWTIVPSPNTLPTQATQILFGVTCASASDCWAAGYSTSGSAFLAGSPFQTLTERWDGASWAIVPSAQTNASENNVLFNVTCSADSDCWTAGYYAGSVSQTLIERWDGTSWAVAASPNPSNGHTNVLYGLACVAGSNCWAVGSAGSATLIERWDGTSWAIATSPNVSASQDNVLGGVACTSLSNCWAVGYYSDATGIVQTLIEHYTASPTPLATGIVSRKTHGTAGVFDIDLPLAGNPGIECRTGGTSNDYQILVTFANAVTFNSAAVTSGTGAVSSTTGNSTPVITVNLTGVTNAQTITVTLAGVNDGNNTGNVGVRMAVLIGDTTADGFVNSGDIAQTKSQSGIALTNANFREDVTADGAINSGDIALVKSKSGTALP